MLLKKCIAAIAAGAFLVPPGALALVLTPRDELVLADAALAPEAATWSWEDCGSPNDVVQIQSFEISPELRPGSKMNVTVNAYVERTVEEGAYADVVIKLGLIKLLQKRYDLCEEARDANTAIQCPVEPGQHVLTQEVELPKEIPPGKFNIAVRAYTVEDDDLVCANIQADFLPKRPGFSMN